MTQLDRRVADLRDLVEDILRQFQVVHAAVVNGPHTGLSAQELRVVELLGDQGAHRMRDLAKSLGLAFSSVTPIADSLENKGIVRRERSREDRREVHVQLTEPGKAAYEAALEEKNRLLRSMLKALTEEEQEIFMVLFRKIARGGQSQVQKIVSSA